MSEKDSKTILLIDDDTSLVVTLSDFLRFEGYEVVTAHSGEQGLEVLASLAPDLIILDMSMPGMGGVGFLESIMGDDGIPHHPVLVLTARASMAEYFGQVEVDGFIAKPCDPSDLLLEVGRIIFLRSGQAEELPESSVPMKGKVLVGMPDEAEGASVGAALTGAGYVVHVVPTGPAVVERAVVERPDAIILTVDLPGMAGSALAAMLKDMDNTRGIPVVLCGPETAELDLAQLQDEGTQVQALVAVPDGAALITVLDGILSY